MRTYSFLILVLSLAGCGGDVPERKPDSAETLPISVKTFAAKSTEWPSVYEATGTVKARTSATLSSRLMANVEEVRVQAGDSVTAGQVLAVLDARDIDTGERRAAAAVEEAKAGLAEVEHAIASAQAQLDLSSATLKRMEDLFRKKSISNQEYDEAKARHRQAEAGYQMALARRSQVESKIRQANEAAQNTKIQRGYAEIRAPFAGYVVEKRVDAGALAAPGTPLFTVEQAGSYRLEASIEESMLSRVRAGSSVTVVLDAFDRAIEGRVAEVVPAVDAASRAFTAKINLPVIPNLRSGVFGRARFPMGSRQALDVPESAISEQGQLRFVFVAESGVARARMVTTGERRQGRVEILSGLNEGDRVIEPRPKNLVDGAKVEAQ
jgi:RND family efflux transporter MFP subunit